MTDPSPSRPRVFVTYSEVSESVRRTDCSNVTLTEAQYREAERLLASALYALIAENLPRLIREAQMQAEEFHATEPPEPIDPETLQEVLDGYQACATWSSVPLSYCPAPPDGCDDDTFDDLGICEWTPEAEAECRADCESFIRDNLPALLRVTDANGYTWERVGHDLWLSRNGHGAGFFDRVGATHKHRDDFDALQEAASAWGEVNLDFTEPDAEGEQRIVIA